MEIETSRLILRKHRPEDFDRFWQLLTDPIGKQYTGGVTRLSRQERLQVYWDDCATPFSDSQTEYAVIRKDNGLYIGYCGFMPAQEISGTEFFYGLCRDSWRKGYGFEAANAALQHFFQHVEHQKYVATVDHDNIASARLIEKLGFQKTHQITNGDGKHIDCYQIERKG